MSLNPSLARQFFDIMESIVDEFRLHISKDGWKVSAVDPGNVALVTIDLPSNSFEGYCSGDFGWTSSIDGHDTGVLQDSIAVGIDITKIKEFLSEVSEDMLEEELSAPVEFTFGPAPKGGYQLELKQGMFSCTILLLPENSIRRAPKVPSLPGLDYKLLIITHEFQRIVKRARNIDDYIRLGFRRREEGSVTFIASADDQPWDATKQVHGWQALKDGARMSSSSLFSQDYLCDIVEKIPAKQVWLYIGQDNPCIISFVLGRTGTVEYKIAPRVESEL